MSEQSESLEAGGLNSPLYCPQCDYGLEDCDCICHLIGESWNATDGGQRSSDPVVGGSE